MDNIHMNYDAVLKDALTLFKDKTLDFLGLHGIPPITEPLSTELIGVEVNKDIIDLAFGLSDGCGLHIEEEVDLSHDDLLRFGVYHLNLNRAHKREFITVIFVKNPVKVSELRTGQLTFTPIIVRCSQLDADAILAKLKTAITNGEPFNELELIYLPLFNSINYTPTELFHESAKLITALQADDKLRQKIAALLITLAGKVVDESVLDKYLEEVKLMGNPVIDYFVKIGKEEGIKLGEERGEERGLRLGEERGEERGRNLGEERKEAETAMKMLIKGYGVQEILDITGISRERLNQIAGHEVA
jgi:hypothetical protein